MVRVNTYRMRFARVWAGLSVGQARSHFGVDTHGAEEVGYIAPAELERLHDLYGVRPRWLEEEGPVADPRSIAATLDLVGSNSADIIVCRPEYFGG